MFRYYLKKLFRLILVPVFQKKRVAGCYIRKGQGKPQCLILDHTDSDVMHWGDLLFFLRIIWSAKSSQIPTYLVGESALLSIFSTVGVQHAVCLADVPVGLVLTKNDSPLFFKKNKHTLIGFNFWRLKGRARISDLVFDVFCLVIKDLGVWPHFKDAPTSFIYQYKNALVDRQFDSALSALRIKDSYILLNSFVGSQKIGTFFRQRFFSGFVKRLSAQNKVSRILIGSKTDVKKTVAYPLDVDLRGQLNVSALIYLFSRPQLKRVVTFDTFIAHLACLHGVSLDVIVKSRSRLTLIKERFVPFYDMQNSDISYQ